MTPHPIFLVILAMTTFALVSCETATPSAAGRAKLAPGQYEWHPQRSARGPVLMVVSIDDQMAYVYRNGVEIARSTVSTGRPGKETPTGVFTVLQRKVEHESNIYKGAQMPYMQRLTWTGIAMHAGDLPGYPASGGCVRLPYEFSEKVYGVMHNGATVAITRKGTVPSRSARPADVLLASRAHRAGDQAIPAPVGEVVWNPAKAPSGPMSILVSYADRRIYVWRNGVEIGQSPIGIARGARPLEGTLMMLEGEEPSDPRFPGLIMHPWSVLSITGGSVAGDVVSEMRSQIQIPAEFRKKVNRALVPGTILLAIGGPSNTTTRSAPGFDIIAPEKRN